MNDAESASKLPPIPHELLFSARALSPCLNNSAIHPSVQLNAAYEYLDKFSVFVKTFASCGKGCAHCCKIDVHITTLEADYIQRKTGITYDRGHVVTTGHFLSCPFLSNDEGCGIYHHRPLVCRIYHATGAPDNCVPGQVQMQYGAPPKYGNQIYASLVSWLHVRTASLGGIMRDIRDFFPHPGSASRSRS